MHLFFDLVKASLIEEPAIERNYESDEFSL